MDGFQRLGLDPRRARSRRRWQAVLEADGFRTILDRLGY